jgi:hypothetical protein
MLTSRQMLLAITVLFCVVGSARAGCPLGANYLNPSNPTAAKVTLASLGITTCYYVSAGGSDSANGTSESTPWLHAPGMSACSATCNSTPPGSGSAFQVGIIFRGGDTWHYGNSGSAPYAGSGGWSYVWKGTSASAYAYVGVDPGWFSGGSWTRPVMNGDNTPSTSAVASCAHTAGGSSDQMATFTGGGFVILDNFEWTGFCWSNGSPTFGNQVMISVSNQGNGQGFYIENMYVHGWTHTAAGTQAQGFAYNVSNQQNGLTLQFSVVDGSDSDPLSLGPYEGDFYVFRYNETKNVGGTSAVDCHIAHDSIFEHINNVTDGSTHSDAFACVGEVDNGSSDPNLFYDLLFHDVGTDFGQAISEVIIFNPNIVGGVHQTDYFFNSIAYNSQPGGSNYFDLNDPNDSTSGGNLTVFNVTGDINATGGSAGCLICNSNGVGSVTAINDHWIGGTSSAPNQAAIFADTGTVTETTPVYMSGNAGTSQGYTSSNNFAPTLGTNSTVGGGTNETSLCGNFSSSIDPTAQSYCKQGYTGISYNSSSNTVSYPAVTPNARPSSGAWDAGAYEFTAGVGGNSGSPSSMRIMIR